MFSRGSATGSAGRSSARGAGALAGTRVGRYGGGCGAGEVVDPTAGRRGYGRVRDLCCRLGPGEACGSFWSS